MASIIEKSPYRIEIEDMILDGVPDRVIAKNMKDNHGIKMNHVTIFNYRKNNLNLNAEAVKQYKRKKKIEEMQPHIDKRINEIEYCDTLITLAEAIELKVDLEAGITALDIKKLGLQAVKVKNDIMKDSAGSRIVVDNVEVSSDPKIRIRARDLVNQLAESTKEDNR